MAADEEADTPEVAIPGEADIPEAVIREEAGVADMIPTATPTSPSWAT